MPDISAPEVAAFGYPRNGVFRPLAGYHRESPRLNLIDRFGPPTSQYPTSSFSSALDFWSRDVRFVRILPQMALSIGALVFVLGGVELGAYALGDEPTEILLWPSGTPGAPNDPGPERVVQMGRAFEANPNFGKHRRVSNIHAPSLTVFRPAPEVATGAAVIVCPGGAHRFLSIDHEGLQVARWLASKGLVAAVLKYRLAKEPGSTYSLEDHVLADASEAVRIVRSHAEEWSVRPNRIGMLGFSSGAELAVLAAAKNTGAETDSKVDFLGLLYPTGGERAPLIDERFPPTFVSAAGDDPVGSEVAMNFYHSLQRHKVPTELHVYARGGHGFGLIHRPFPIAQWPDRFEAWMRDQGFFHEVGEEAPLVRSGVHAPPGLEGKWLLRVEGTLATVVFTNGDEGFKGTIDRGDGPIPLDEIRYADGKLVFKVLSTFYNAKTKLVYRGVVQGSKIFGEVDYARENSPPGAIDFEGHREDGKSELAQEKAP